LKKNNCIVINHPYIHQVNQSIDFNKGEIEMKVLAIMGSPKGKGSGYKG
jgi:hypothetical protein